MITTITTITINSNGKDNNNNNNNNNDDNNNDDNDDGNKTVIREQPVQRRGVSIVYRPSSSRPPVDRRFAWKVSAECFFRLSDFSLRVGSMHE